MASMIIRIKNGQVSIDMDNIIGPNCEGLAEKLTEALGIVDIINQKPQYFQELDNIEVKQCIGKD